MEFALTERTEPFTLEEVFDFIDDTNISKIDAHELKSRIVDVVQDARNKAIDEFVDASVKEIADYSNCNMEAVLTQFDVIRIAEQMKGV